MASSINDFLGFIPLTKLVEQVKTGIPNPLGEYVPNLFNLKEQVIGDTFGRVTFQGTRQLARNAPYMSAAREVAKQPFGNQDLKMLTPKEGMTFTDEYLKFYREFERYEPQQDRFMEILRKQTSQLKARFENFRVAAVHAMLANGGKLYLDSNGYLLPSSSGADLTIDCGVPSANVGNPASLFSTSISNPATDLVTPILNLKALALKQSGFPLKYAFYGPAVAAAFSANTSLQTYMSRNPSFNDRFLNTGVIPDGLLGLTWVPVQDAFFADSSNTNQSIFAADYITFTPDINANTWGMYEGTTRVITQFGVASNPEVALGANSTEHSGMGAYAFMNHEPLSVRHYMFDCFLPNIKVPNAFFFVTATA